MNRVLLLFIFLASYSAIWAQSTFKAGWSTYQTGTLIHEYSYNLINNDTTRLTFTDSVMVLISPDSLVTETISFPAHEKSVYKKVQYFNDKKQIARIEEYKDDNLLVTNEWRYDDKNRKVCHTEDNKATGNNFKKNYDYVSDKKSGDLIVMESSYLNGRIEFYTKTFYDRHNVKYKEIRLNDNNKDVVHIESFYYNDDGKLRERSVYFPEWKVTKKFQEKEGNIASGCIKSLPVGTAEKITIPGRVNFMRRLLSRYQPVLNNPDCKDFEYTFKNFLNCDIIVSTTNLPSVKKVVFRFKEKNPK